MISVNPKQLAQLIEYQPGLLILPTGEEEFSHLDVHVVRLEHGRLLVRLEERTEVLEEVAELPEPDLDAELEVGVTEALIRLDVTIERIARLPEEAYMVFTRINDFEVIQRRKDQRYKVNFQCRFIPVKSSEDVGRVLTDNEQKFGVGRVCNFSLGGFQFVTDYRLPIGMLAFFVIQTPSSHLELVGTIVQGREDLDGGHAYGVKLSGLDNTTAQRLNRLVLKYERRERLARESAVGTGSARGRRSVRGGWRLVNERWDQRERRRQRREREV